MCAANGSRWCTVDFAMIHIGKAIEAEMRRQERSPAWLARKINCERTNIYYIFSQPSINTDMLARISRALDHDFFRDLSNTLQTGSTSGVKNIDGTVKSID